MHKRNSNYFWIVVVEGKITQVGVCRKGLCIIVVVAVSLRIWRGYEQQRLRWEMQWIPILEKTLLEPSATHPAESRFLKTLEIVSFNCSLTYEDKSDITLASNSNLTISMLSTRSSKLMLDGVKIEMRVWISVRVLDPTSLFSSTRCPSLRTKIDTSNSFSGWWCHPDPSKQIGTMTHHHHHSVLRNLDPQ